MARASIALYPVLTLFSIVVTANHYWIDAVGGAGVVALGYVVGDVVHRWLASRQAPPAMGEAQRQVTRQ